MSSLNNLYLNGAKGEQIISPKFFHGFVVQSGVQNLIISRKMLNNSMLCGFS